MLRETLAEVVFEHYRKPTRRERFLDEMNRVVPWTDLGASVEPVYLKAEDPGRPPLAVEWVLRLHCLQRWCPSTRVERRVCEQGSRLPGSKRHPRMTLPNQRSSGEVFVSIRSEPAIFVSM